MPELNVSTARGGVLVFYAMTAIFGLASWLVPDPTYKSVLLWMGRGFGLFMGGALVIVGLQDLHGAEIEEELNGRPDEPVWRAVNRALAWGSPLVSAWQFYSGNVWEGFMYLGYPAWLILLRLEARRRRIVAGRARTSFFWRALLYLSAAACAVSFALTVVLPHGGPKFLWDGEVYRFFPFLTMASIPFIIAGAVGCGGRVHD
jgi:hypothetical protein